MAETIYPLLSEKIFPFSCLRWTSREYYINVLWNVNVVSLTFIAVMILKFFSFSRYAENFVNQTVDKINQFVKEGRDIPDRFSFMSHLISSKDLSSKDITVLSLSLFLDGLSTVSRKKM